MKIVVTGGAGFIGSHAVDALVNAGHDVSVLDNLSSGNREFLADSEGKFAFIEGDALDPATLDAAFAGADSVWHFAANPEVRTGETDPGAHYDLNVAMTWQVLEAMRRAEVKNLVFTSTSTVYGNADIMPTPENYGPLLPISVYGGAKLACEALIASFAGTFDINALLFRFANVVGPRSNHGVTYDFVNKLLANPELLTILGDGTQNKSYVHVVDTVAGMMYAFENAPTGVHPYNVGSADGITVTELAGIVSSAMELTPKFEYTGGNGGAGWKGDVKFMGLSIEKMQQLGWNPAMTSAQAIRDTALWLQGHDHAS